MRTGRVHTRTRFWITLLVGLIACIGAAQPGMSAPQSPQTAAPKAPLFQPVDTPQTASAPLDPQVLRSRRVVVDWSQLNSETNPSAELALNLFVDTTLTAERTRVEYRGPGSYTWFGQISNDPLSYVILSVQDGIMMGTIADAQALYQVRYAGGDLYELQQVDPDSLAPAEADMLMPDDTSPALQTDSAATAPAEGVPGASVDATGMAIVDVMIVYTPAAELAVGGEAAMQALIQLGMDTANLALTQSQVQGRLRLVHTQSVNYVESGTLKTDLGRLQVAGDGFLDDVHALRAAYGADLVSLFVDNYSSECGRGYVLMSQSGEAPFSALTYSCGGSMSLAHELGHNMGLCHDALNDSSCSKRTQFYPYARGYQDPAGRFRSIMAYHNGCTLAGGCTRIPFFSNPRLTFNGAPMGSAAADAAQALNGTMPIAATWKPTRVAEAADPALAEIAAQQIVPASSAIIANLTNVRLAALDAQQLVVAGKRPDNMLSLSLWHIADEAPPQQIASAHADDIAAIGQIRHVAIAALSPSRIATRVDLATTCSSGEQQYRYQIWDIDAQGDFQQVSTTSYCRSATSAEIVALSPTRLAVADQLSATTDDHQNVRLGIIAIDPSGKASNSGGLYTLTGDHIALSALDGKAADPTRTLMVATALDATPELHVSAWQVSAAGGLTKLGEHLLSGESTMAAIAAGDTYAVIAGQDADGRLRLSSWKTSVARLAQVTSLNDRPIKAVTGTNLAPGSIVTVAHDADQQQTASLWRVSRHGHIALLAQARSATPRQAGAISSVGLSADRVVVADALADGNVMLQVWQVRQVVADEGSTAMLSVALDAPVNTEVTISYAVTGGTATGGRDYTLAPGTLTFAPGETTQQIVVPILADTTPEPDETIEVALTSATGALLGATSHVTVTIDGSEIIYLPLVRQP